MNTFLGVVWGLINPEMFAAVADTLEDVMQASVPGVIENVRVAEINQGSNPIRILSLRALPDDHVKELKNSIHEENKKIKDPQEAAADEEGGDFYNVCLNAPKYITDTDDALAGSFLRLSCQTNRKRSICKSKEHAYATCLLSWY
jgi:hypothetical protein